MAQFQQRIYLFRNIMIRKKWETGIKFLAFVLPAMIWFVSWMIWPLINMFRISLLKWDGLTAKSTFIGLGNYARFFSDPHFHTAIKNSLIEIGVALPGVMIPAFILGYFLSLRLPGFRILRFIIFIPAMVSVGALAMMFLGVYMPDGILNSVLNILHLNQLTHIWLADTSTVLGAIIALDIWTGIGFYAILFFSMLSNIRPELYEAARLDGATQWKMIWKIAFPLSKGFFGVASMLHFLWLLTGAAQNVLILTRGGPGDYSLTLGYYLYDQAFITQRLGYSQSIGVFLFVVGIIGILIIRRNFRSDAME